MTFQLISPMFVSLQCVIDIVYEKYSSGGFRGGGGEPAPLPPLGDRLTQSLAVILANAKCWSFYCKTWYSEYSKWLPPVAFWQL